MGAGVWAVGEWGGAALARGYGIPARREPPVPGLGRAGWPESGRGDIPGSDGTGRLLRKSETFRFTRLRFRCSVPFKYKIVAVFE